MADNGIHIEGLDDVLKNLSKLGPEVRKAAMDGLKKGGLNIIADAQENLKKNGHNGRPINATGQLSNSGRVQELRDESLEVGFFSQGSEEGHAAIVEYGSTKRWWAPLRYLHDWAMVKFSVNEKDAWPIAKGTQKRIHERGLIPHPFFGPAVNDNKSKLIEAVKGAINAKITK